MLKKTKLEILIFVIYSGKKPTRSQLPIVRGILGDLSIVGDEQFPKGVRGGFRGIR